MLQFLSVLCGLAAALLMIFGLVPLLGSIQWVVLVLVVLGIIFGAFPQKKTGLIINIAVGVVAILRLFLGGGLL
jgi:hypothetical protein